MTGIIRAPRPTKDYFDVRNATARDRRLSYRARGILLRLLSNLDGYRMTAEDLAREGKEGRGAVLTALTELRAAGYMRTIRTQNARGQWTTTTYVYDTPQLSHDPTEVQKPDSGFPDVCAPDVGSSAAIKNNQKNDKQEKQQYSQPAGAAARGGRKTRRARLSGIVTWTSDDVSEAERLEAAWPGQEISAAVAAVSARGKDPVPGLVAREAEKAARRREAEARAKAVEEERRTADARLTDESRVRLSMHGALSANARRLAQTAKRVTGKQLLDEKTG